MSPRLCYSDAVKTERKHIQKTRRPPFASGYPLKEAASLVGLSPAQVQSYLQAGFLEPRRGPRGEYRFSFQDLVLLRTARELSVQLPARKVKRALVNLKTQLPPGKTLSSVRIVVQGQRLVVRDGESLWNPESGQALLDFDVSSLTNETAPLVHETVTAARDAASERSAEDWYELACELEGCDAQQACEAYARVLELDPRHVDAHINRGRMLHEGRDLRGAESHYRRALEIEPEEATAAFNLGVLLEDLGRPLEASLAYERAIRADPDNGDAHYNLAHVYERLGREQEAVRHLQRYRQLSRQD
jgi:tetratricopeptide (TPR) repeat protein